MMILTTVLLVIGFVAIAGILARVSQVTEETLNERERPLLSESSALARGMDRIMLDLVPEPEPAPWTEDDVQVYIDDVRDAAAHLRYIESSRGFAMRTELVRCIDVEADAQVELHVNIRSGGTQIRLVASSPVFEAVECPEQADPGFAYEDVDLDFKYRADTDNEIQDADIQVGQYDVRDSLDFDAGLVIPPSVGGITAERIDFVANGGVWIDVDLTATGDLANQDVEVRSLAGEVRIGPVELRARGDGRDVHVVAAGGDLSLDGAKLRVSDDLSNSDITLTAAGTIQAENTTMRAGGDLQVEVTDESVGDGIHVENAHLRVDGQLVLDVDSDGDGSSDRSVYVANAKFTTSGGNTGREADVEPGDPPNPGVVVGTQDQGTIG